MNLNLVMMDARQQDRLRHARSSQSLRDHLPQAARRPLASVRHRHEHLATPQARHSA
jgi:hypothetical protein